MKQKYLKVLILGLFLTYAFLPFGLVPTTQAACSYTTTLKADKSALTKDATVYLDASATRSGTQCLDKVYFNFYVKTNQIIASGVTGSGASGIQLTNLAIQTKVNPNPGGQSSFLVFTDTKKEEARASVQYSLSNINWNIQQPSNLDFFVVLSDQYTFSPTQLGNIPTISIPVSGSTNVTNTSGARSISINFDRGEYQDGDTVVATYTLNNTSNTQAVEIKTYVNDSKLVGQFSKSADEIRTAQTQRIDVNKDNNFKKGQNKISVKMTLLSNSGVLFAEGQANITASGNNLPEGTTTTPGGSTETKRYACKAKDSTYLCSTTEDFGLQEIDTTKCATLDVLQVDSCSCNKTDEQIKTQCTTTTPGGNNGPSFNCNSSNAKSDPNYSKFCLINPLPSDNLIGTFLSITKGFLAGLAIWAVIAIIFAGFRMVISAGNEEAITQAKKAITWAIIGLVVALLSFSIVAIVQNILKVDVSKLNPNGMNKDVTKHNYL